jgi:pilus assembly protein Flp/PilA
MLARVRNLLRNKKGQGMVEYGILVGGIALICLVSVAILGHKANDLLGTVAAALPGAHADDNGAIVSGKLVNTTSNASGAIVLNAAAPGSIEGNVGIPGIGAMVVEP